MAGALENALTLSSLCMLPCGTRHADKKETASKLQVMEYSTFCSPYLTPPQRKDDPSTLHLTLNPDLCLQHGWHWWLCVHTQINHVKKCWSAKVKKLCCFLGVVACTRVKNMLLERHFNTVVMTTHSKLLSLWTTVGPKILVCHQKQL